MGLFLAYLLDPIVDLLEKIGIGRSLAAASTIFIFFIFLISITFLILPLLLYQIKDFTEKFPQLIEQINSKLSQVILSLKTNLSSTSKLS